MKKEIIIKNTLVTAIALLIFLAVSLIISDYYTDMQQKDSIIHMSHAYRSGFRFEQDGDYSDFTALPQSAKDQFRVTVISQDGEVLADSSAMTDGMDSHAGREEFLQALTYGDSSVVTRYSDTFGYRMRYYAFKVEDGGNVAVIRLAVRAQNINSYAIAMVPVLIVLVIAVLLLSALFTVRLNRNILRAFKIVEINLHRINKGTYKMVMPTFKQPEINRAVIGLNDIQDKIKENIRSLSEQSQKLDSILESAEQGIIALNSAGEIILINSFAKNIFAIKGSVEGKDILYTGCGKKFNDSLSGSIAAGGGSFEHIAFEREYLVKVNISSGSSGISTVIVMSDITALKKMQKLRSDFFANASHELKTPLTGIFGFAELISGQDDLQSIKDYNEYILKDSRRMLKLIDDMLKLSRLDTRWEGGKRRKVDVLSLAKDAAENLKITADAKNIDITVTGEGTCLAEQENIYELLENLISNAVRYNTEDGKVNVTLQNVGSKCKIIVSDTGIGIAAEDQLRVFERFYRVDRGRSTKSGGTGLGLSIVKHIVGLYNGQIDLQSERGSGTTVTVVI